MSMEEKNKWLINYVNLLSKQINEQYGNIVHKEHIDRVISMYKDSDKKIETIKDEIDKIAKEFIENYLKRMQEIREEMLRKKQEEQEKMLEQLRKLNSSVQIDIQNEIKNEQIESKIISSIPKEQLKLPENITLDENNRIINNNNLGNNQNENDLDSTFIMTYPNMINDNSKDELINYYVKKYNEIKNQNITKEQFFNWINQKQPNLTENERLAFIYREFKNNLTSDEKDKIFDYFKKIESSIKTEDDLTSFVQNAKLKSDLSINPEQEINKIGKLITIPANPEQGFNYPFMIYIPNNLDKNQVNNLLLHSCNTPEGMLDYSKVEEFTKIEQLKSDSLHLEMANKGSVPLIMPIIPRFRGYNPEYIENGMQRSNLETFIDMQSKLDPKYQMTREQIEYEFNKSQNIIEQQMKMSDYAISYLKNNGINMDNKIIVEGHSAGSKNAASLINQYPDRIASYVIGGTTGISKVNDNSIPGIIYNGVLDKNNPAEFYYDEKGISRAKSKEEYSDKYIQNVVEPRYKKSLEEWKNENTNKDVKEFNVVQYDIQKQHKLVGDKSLLVDRYGHNAIDSPIVKQKAVDVVKNTKIKSNDKQEKSTQQETKKESKPIPKQPSITPKRQEEKQIKKSEPIKMNKFEKKAYPPLKQKQEIKKQAKQQVNNKSNVITLKNNNKSGKSGNTSSSGSKGFINIILGSLLVIILCLILFIILN